MVGGPDMLASTGYLICEHFERTRGEALCAVNQNKIKANLSEDRGLDMKNWHIKNGKWIPRD